MMFARITTYSIDRTVVIRHIILITVDIIDLISSFECTQTKAISMRSTDVSRGHAETTVICRACTCVGVRVLVLVFECWCWYSSDTRDILVIDKRKLRTFRGGGRGGPKSMLLGESQTINIRFWCNNIYTYIFRCKKMTRFFVHMLASSCSRSHTVTGLLLLLC